MTSREKRMVIALGIFAAFGIVFGLYYFVVSPYQDARAQAKDLENQYALKSDTLTNLEVKQAKLKSLLPRSLPGDLDVARREYEALLSSLLRSSGVPSGYTVTAKDPGDANRVPMLAPKVPAYSRVGYDIVLRKVDLPTVVKFLEAYYKQPVLQQITRFTIKRTTVEAGDSGAKRADSRADLEVQIATEGVIIDGTPKRQTLYPVSTAFGALGGGAGLGLLQNSPDKTRTLFPGPLPTQLAENRDYALLVAKDLFHGPLPEIKAPKPPKEPPPPKEEPKVVEAPKEDLSPFIRLTGITWRSDGSVVAEILDMANRHEYEVARVFTLDGVWAVRVKKYFYINADRKPLESFDDLVIAEDGTATDRKFKVLEFKGDGLVLSEMPLALPAKDAKAADETPTEEEPKVAAKGSSKTSGKTSGKGSIKSVPKKIAATGPQVDGALAGPLVFAPVKPVEKRYFWRIGSTLKAIEEVPLPGKVVAEPPMPPAKVLEVSPMPVPAKPMAETPKPMAAKDVEVSPMPRLEK